MSDLYITVAKTATAEFEEKRSVFLGHAAHSETEAEATEFVKSKQSEYRDATHNVWAYYMKNGILARYSDDGEPTGTAGLPTLEAIRKAEVDDVCVVVTRYFGGILLGAGGLVRAYSKAATLAVEAAGRVTYEPFSELEIVCNYSDYQKIQNELPRFGAITDSTDFTESVCLRIALPQTAEPDLVYQIANLCAARPRVTPTGTRRDIKQ